MVCSRVVWQWQRQKGLIFLKNICQAELGVELCVIFSAVALRGRPMHRCGGKRSICERSRMLSPAGHSPGTPLLRCFSNPPQVQVSIPFTAGQQKEQEVCLGSCEQFQ